MPVRLPVAPSTHGEYVHANPNKSASYLYPRLADLLHSHPIDVRSVIDIGCGTGDIAARLSADGYDVCGVDASSDGIRQAKLKYPHLRFERRSIYDDVWELEGPYDAVITTEVIEHLYFPRRLISVASALLKPGGILIVTTPYHGYMKYLMLAVTGRMDPYLQALRDHGHIKFFSPATMRELLVEGGFERIQIGTAGRIGPVAKSMIASGRKPESAKQVSAV